MYAKWIPLHLISYLAAVRTCQEGRNDIEQMHSVLWYAGKYKTNVSGQKVGSNEMQKRPHGKRFRIGWEWWANRAKRQKQNANDRRGQFLLFASIVFMVRNTQHNISTNARAYNMNNNVMLWVCGEEESWGDSDGKKKRRKKED